MTVIEMKPVRERILDAAVECYYAEGIRAVSADRLIGEAHVSKATFYRYFPTKDDLIAAYLEVRSDAETDAVTSKRAELAGHPAATLRWYAEEVGLASCSSGFRGCPFINAAAELPETAHPGRVIISTHRAWLTSQAAELLDEMGVTESDRKSEQLMMLRDGAMVSGYLGHAPDEVAGSLVAAARAIIAS